MSYEPVFRNPKQDGVPLHVVEKLLDSIKGLESFVTGLATKIPNSESSQYSNNVTVALQKLIERLELTLIGENKDLNQSKRP